MALVEIATLSIDGQAETASTTPSITLSRGDGHLICVSTQLGTPLPPKQFLLVETLLSGPEGNFSLNPVRKLYLQAERDLFSIAIPRRLFAGSPSVQFRLQSRYYGPTGGRLAAFNVRVEYNDRDEGAIVIPL